MSASVLPVFRLCSASALQMFGQCSARLATGCRARAVFATAPSRKDRHMGKITVLKEDKKDRKDKKIEKIRKIDKIGKIEKIKAIAVLNKDKR